jgi:putative flavoprotein involved in K+ transport
MNLESERPLDTIVVGAGQAGLAAGYLLKQARQNFLIIDARERVGDAWRLRWDSCTLFTPACYNSLPGLRFPQPPRDFPTKDEMADYLDAYAAHHELPVQLGATVESLHRVDGHYAVRTQGHEYHAQNVIVAAGATPYVPPFALELDPRILQIHSTEYRRPSQLKDGDVLVVGSGNSGADIALELAQARRTWMSGSDFGSIPIPAKHLFWYWFLAHHQIIVGSPIWHFVKGLARPLLRSLRKGRPYGRTQSSTAVDTPRLAVATRPSPGSRLVRVRLRDLTDADVEIAPRTCGTRQGLPLLEDGRLISAANVVWCTGFRPAYSRWIHVPVFAADGMPIHDRGIVAAAPGLYFVGRPFQRSVTSDLIIDMSKHTAYVLSHLLNRCTPEGNHRISPSSRDPKEFPRSSSEQSKRAV